MHVTKHGNEKAHISMSHTRFILAVVDDSQAIVMEGWVGFDAEWEYNRVHGRIWTAKWGMKWFSILPIAFRALGLGREMCIRNKNGREERY